MHPDAFADLVVGLVKNALSPILERVASVETRVHVLGDVRDRVVGLETKAAMPVVLPAVPEVDLAPMTARVVAVEAQMQMLLDVRDRVVGLESKAVTVTADPSRRIDDLAADVSKLEDAIGEMKQAFADTLAAMRERVAVVETKALIPGPPGPAGADGQDGAPGKDGRDGVAGKDGTLENLKMVRQSERVVEFTHKDGTPVEGGMIRISHPFFKGIFGQVPEIERDDLVQYAGSIWIALKDNPTMKPGSSSPEVTGWRMFAKAGRDGKDTLPVVARG